MHVEGLVLQGHQHANHDVGREQLVTGVDQLVPCRPPGLAALPLGAVRDREVPQTLSVAVADRPERAVVHPAVQDLDLRRPGAGQDLGGVVIRLPLPTRLAQSGSRLSAIEMDRFAWAWK